MLKKGKTKVKQIEKEVEIDDIDKEEEFDDIDIEETEENLTIIVEEDYDDYDDDFYQDPEEDRFEVIYNLNTNKHKQDGKHSLDRDTIFKGKLEEKQEFEIEDTSYSSTKIETGSLYEYESRYHVDYLNQKNISTDVFQILDDKTNLNYRQNRRKPNKQIFNDYYELLIKELNNKYTNYEIFVELAYYFTDQIFNMFKLLDKKHALNIIKELKIKGYLKDLDNLNFV